MLLARASLPVILVALAGGCAAGILPPSRTEIGSAVIATDEGPRSGLRLATGAPLASGQVRPDVGFDVGGGYLYERQATAGAEPGPDTVAFGAEPGAGAAGGPGPAAPAAPIEGHGAYLEVSHVLQGRGASRSWLGARGELMRLREPGASRTAAGLYARAAWELFAAGSEAGSGPTRCGFATGFAHGTFAVGLFVESGARWVEGEEPAFVAVGGLSLRMPWMGGMVLDLCSWC